MVFSDRITTPTPTITVSPTSPPYFSSSPLSTPSCSPPYRVDSLSPPPPTVVLSPCAACKILRRRCIEKCILAPYFPPTDPLRFTIVHRVWGASNIIKLLQELPESHRADAVSSLVYEANVRIRDPVYGCAGAICHLQKQISDLQAELAKTQAEIVNVQCQQNNLMSQISQEPIFPQEQVLYDNATFSVDDGNWGTLPTFEEGFLITS